MSRRFSFAEGAVFGAVLAVSIASYAALGGPDGVMIPYTGRLESNGVGANGSYVFRFELFDVATAGVACTGTPAIPDVTTNVVSGAFSVVVGPVPEACVLGKPVWVAVKVKLPAEGSFTALNGRQRVFPTVAAHTAGQGDFKVVGSVDSADNVTTSTGFTNGLRLGDVGFGSGFLGAARTNHANTTDYAIIQGEDGTTYLNSATGKTLYLRVGNADQATLAGGRMRLNGENVPVAKEDLRMVRGTIDAAGTAIRGAGYTSSRPSGGVYQVTFSTAFSAPPTVTCSAHHPTDGAQTGGVAHCLVEHANQVTANGFRVSITAGDNSLQNWGVSFIAMGPR
jgi:hypothetical protein